MNATNNREQGAEWSQTVGAMQTAWRGDLLNGICREQGRRGGRSYPWILPPEKWEQNLWPGIRFGSANPLPAYLKNTKIHPHPDKNNLISSRVLCANLFFPFGASAEGRALLAGFLSSRTCRLMRPIATRNRGSPARLDLFIQNTPMQG